MSQVKSPVSDTNEAAAFIAYWRATPAQRVAAVDEFAPGLTIAQDMEPALAAYGDVAAFERGIADAPQLRDILLAAGLHLLMEMPAKEVARLVMELERCA